MARQYRLYLICICESLQCAGLKGGKTGFTFWSQCHLTQLRSLGSLQMSSLLYCAGIVAGVTGALFQCVFCCSTISHLWPMLQDTIWWFQPKCGWKPVGDTWRSRIQDVRIQDWCLGCICIYQPCEFDLQPCAYCVLKAGNFGDLAATKWTFGNVEEHILFQDHKTKAGDAGIQWDWTNSALHASPWLDGTRKAKANAALTLESILRVKEVRRYYTVACVSCMFFAKTG